MIHRILTEELVSAAVHMPIMTLNGPRQSGKTTLARDAFPSYAYINLELPDMRTFAGKDPRTFLSNYTHGVIIDEAQYVPELFSYIQGMVDENEALRFVLTGSQNFSLSEKISQSLAGRTCILSLLPLSLYELQLANHTYDKPISYIWRGGYPRLYKHAINPSKWLTDYIQTHVERDVRNMIQIKDLVHFQTFLQLCAGRIGQVLNHASLANDVGVSDKNPSLAEHARGQLYHLSSQALLQ